MNLFNTSLKLYKKIKNLNTLYYILYLRHIKLNPITVNRKQSKYFFELAKPANNHLITHLIDEIISAECIFDIGANVGYFAKGILDVGFTGRILLFEPIPNLLSHAIFNLREYTNEKLFINAALGCNSQSLEIYLPDDSNIGWITFISEKTNSKSIIEVRVQSTEEYINLYKPDFLKIDVEGYEFNILKPLVKLISLDYQPTLLVEVGWGITNPNWTELVTIFQAFYEKGYVFYKIKDFKIPITLSELNNLNQTTDIIFAPSKNRV
jgi:FkbM family methyltransferase